MWISLYIDMQLIKTFDTAVTVKTDMKMRMRVNVVGWNMDGDLKRYENRDIGVGRGLKIRMSGGMCQDNDHGREGL